MAPRKPPSALRLQRALGGGRPAPGGPVGWVLYSQRPEPEQPWREAGRYATAEAAEDELAAPFPAPDPGTVFCLVREGAPLRLGRVWFVTREGRVERAPPVPRDVPRLTLSWVEAWEGEGAQAPWMFWQCARVARVPLVLAACACIREVLPRVPRAWDGGEIQAAVEAAEAWCRGEARPDEVRRAVDAALARPRIEWADLEASRSEDYNRLAAASAHLSLASAVWGICETTWSRWDKGVHFAAANAASMAARAASGLLNPDYDAIRDEDRPTYVYFEGSAPPQNGPALGRRALAPLVRRYVSLGMMLSGVPV